MLTGSLTSRIDEMNHGEKRVLGLEDIGEEWKHSVNEKNHFNKNV